MVWRWLWWVGGLVIEEVFWVKECSWGRWKRCWQVLVEVDFHLVEDVLASWHYITAHLLLSRNRHLDFFLALFWDLHFGLSKFLLTVLGPQSLLWAFHFSPWAEYSALFTDTSDGQHALFELWDHQVHTKGLRNDVWFLHCFFEVFSLKSWGCCKILDHLHPYGFMPH